MKQGHEPTSAGFFPCNDPASLTTPCFHKSSWVKFCKLNMRKILEVAFHNHIQLILNLNCKLLYFNELEEPLNGLSVIVNITVDSLLIRRAIHKLFHTHICTNTHFRGKTNVSKHIKAFPPEAFHGISLGSVALSRANFCSVTVAPFLPHNILTGNFYSN